MIRVVRIYKGGYHMSDYQGKKSGGDGERSRRFLPSRRSSMGPDKIILYKAYFAHYTIVDTHFEIFIARWRPNGY